MASRTEVLQKKAKRSEAKILQAQRVTKERVYALEQLLQDVYANRRPKPIDYQVRRNLVFAFNEIAKEIYANSEDIPVVVEFGSFVMDLFGASSDLDLSVNFSPTAFDCPREKKIQTLKKFARKLNVIQSKGHVSGVQPILTAKVPVVKCVDRGTGVECDISVENRDGISKSQIIHIISSIDERFQKLSFLMKAWAKAHNINSSREKTLNSLSIILLVAFHLQTRDPPILPPFSAIFKDGTDPATVVRSLSNFLNYGKRNRESLAELFITLLVKLSAVEGLWPEGLCASTYIGSWTSKSQGSKLASISVEDFTNRSQNVARAVGQAQLKRIYECIKSSFQHVSSFMDGQIGFHLMDLLFGQDGSPTTSHRVAPGNLLPITTLLPCIPSPQINQRGRALTGKRSRTSQPVQSYGVAWSGSWGRVEQPMVSESSVSSKRMRKTESHQWMPNGSSLGGLVHLEGLVGTQHAIATVPRDPASWQPPVIVPRAIYVEPEPGEAHPHVARGWGGTTRPPWTADPYCRSF